jgi:hypothetical protein
MVQPVGAANNGVSNPSTFPTNTAKSPARATKNSNRKTLTADQMRGYSLAVLTAVNTLTTEGKWDALDNLPSVKFVKKSKYIDALDRALVGGNPDGLTKQGIQKILNSLMQGAKSNGCSKLLLFSDRCQIQIMTKTFGRVQLYVHEVNSEFFDQEQYSDIDDALTDRITRALYGDDIVDKFVSGGSTDDVDSAFVEMGEDVDGPDVPFKGRNVEIHCANRGVGITLSPRLESNHNSDANLPRRNLITESLDESVFHEDTGMTEARNRAESSINSVSPEGRDINTRRPSETGNTHNEVAGTDERSNPNAEANLLLRSSSAESFDENVFRENAGLTEERNLAESSSNSVSSEGSDLYTRPTNETGNTHNQAARTDERSNSPESSTSTSNISRHGFSEQSTVKQRMLAANENHLHVAGPEDLSLNIETKKSPQPETIEEPALQEATSSGFNTVEFDGREDILQCLSSFQSNQAADLKEINKIKLALEKLQQSDPDSANAPDIQFVQQNLEERSRVQERFQQFLLENKDNVTQPQMKPNDITRSGEKIEGGATLLRIDSFKRAARLTPMEMVEQIEGLMPTEEIVKSVERLVAQREASSPSTTKATAGSAVSSPSSVSDIEDPAFGLSDSKFGFSVVIPQNGNVVTTTTTFNGSESKTTLIPKSPPGSPTEINVGNTRLRREQVENLLEKDKRKVAKNMPSTGTAGIES